MVKAICIDDANRPNEIRFGKWLKKGQEYTIIYTTLCLPQRTIGCHLEEIELTNDELPYQYFMLCRFAFTEDEFLKLQALIQECNDTHFDMNELLKQTQLQPEKI